MTDEQKQYISMHLSILKKAMQDEKLIFGIGIDKHDGNNSTLAIIDRDEYMRTGHMEGVFVSITELNNGLFEVR